MRYHLSKKAVRLLGILLLLATAALIPASPQFGGVAEAADLIRTYGAYIDNLINSASTITNYGTEATFNIRSSTTGNQRSLLEFDLSNAASCEIESATLKLFYDSDVAGDPGNRTVWAYKLDQTAWAETTSDWTHYDYSKALGSTNVGVLATYKDYLQGNKWTASASGTIRYVRFYGAYTGKVKFAIYADNAGAVGSLLSGQPVEKTVTTASIWNEATLGNSVSVTSGTTYWILYNEDTTGVVYYSAGSGSSTKCYKSLAYATAFPNPPTGLSYDAGAWYNVQAGINSWTTAGGDYVTSNPDGANSTVPLSTANWQEWDVTDIVQDALDNESGWVEILLKDATEGSATAYEWKYGSSESTTAWKRPQLIVNFGEKSETTNWYSNSTMRYRIDVNTGSSGHQVDNFAIPLDVFYNCAKISADSSTQFLFRQAAYYSGSHSRVYIQNYSSTGALSMQYYDEAEKYLSDSIVVRTGMSGEDHDGGNVIVLQHQTGDNTIHNGTILVSIRNGSAVGTLRSIAPEDISAWGDVVLVDLAASGYPNLAELSDGTIYMFYADSSGIISRAKLTLGATPSSDSWGSHTQVTDLPVGSYVKTWVNGNDVHLVLNDLYGGAGDQQWTYADVYYIKYQGSDNTWRTAGGVSKTAPIDETEADLVWDTDRVGEHDTICWDIKTDASGNPYIIFIDSIGVYPQSSTVKGDIYRANYTGGAWVATDTGIDTQNIGTYAFNSLKGGAELDQGNMNVILACVPDAGNYTQVEIWECPETWPASGSWSRTEQVTQSAPGDAFRPQHVLDGTGDFEWLWFYTERYVIFNDWESIRFAYPGFSNGQNIGCKKYCSSDFGDLTFTQSDGETLQPAASSGKPWIEEKVDYWRAKVWINVGNITETCDAHTIYMYVGDGSANANTQAIMDAQFLACDGFDDGTTLDTDKWTVVQGDVAVASGNLELTGTVGTRGVIDQNTTNYPALTIGTECRMKWKGSDSAPSLNQNMGMRADSSGSTINDAEIIYTTDTNNQVYTWTANGGSSTSNSVASQYVADWHIWRINWATTSVVRFYNDVLRTTNRQVDYLRQTHTTNIDGTSQKLTAMEGSTAGGTVYIDWIIAYPAPYPDMVVSVAASGEEFQFEITTLSATLVKSTSATMWGNNTGTADAIWVGFVYGLTDKGDPGDVAPSESGWDGYVVTNDDTPYTQGTTFSLSTDDGNLTPLSPETCYWCRAWGNSTSGVNAYGDPVWFCTSSEDYDFGIVAVNTEYTTSVTQFFFKNCGSTTGNVTISSSVYMVGSGGNWTVSTDATNGADIVGIKAGVDDDDDTYDVIVKPTGSTPYNLLKGNLAGSGNFTFGIWMLTPTGYSDGSEKTLTITTWFEVN